MANFTAADVKRLRELTGAGMLDCKNALAESGGDFDKAVEALRIKGAKDVGKRAERATAEGLQARAGLGRGDGKPEAESAEPLAEWEQELLASATTAPAAEPTAAGAHAETQTESTSTEG